MYQFDVKLFEFMNAPSTFQRVMDRVPRKLHFVSCYIHVVVIFFVTTKEHMISLILVFAIIKEHELRLKLSMCFLDQDSVFSLGPIVDEFRIRVDTYDMEFIINSLVPQTTS